jgi:glycosyltransferase involved in cell wall biosynthesis
MSSPVVTIVLPVYNVGRYLDQCLATIINQSFTDWELIAIDDGSIDNSLEILRSISDTRVQVFENGTNRGVSFTRNYAVSKARGEFIALQDADDYMHPDRIAHQLQFLKANPALDLVGTFMTLIEDHGNIIGIRKSTQEHFSVNGLLFKSAAPAHATLMGRESWFLRNPYPENIARAEDKYVIVNAVRNSDFSYGVLERPLYNYRFQGSKNFGKRLVAYRTERRYLAQFLDTPTLKVAYVLKSFGKSFITRIRFIQW